MTVIYYAKPRALRRRHRRANASADAFGAHFTLRNFAKLVHTWKANGRWFTTERSLAEPIR